MPGVGFDLLVHEAGVALQGAALEQGCEESELLGHELGGDIVRDPLAEDGHRELIHLAGAELPVGGVEVGIMGLRSGEYHEGPTGEPDLKHLAVFPPGALEQGHRVTVEGQRLPEDRPPPARPRDRSRAYLPRAYLPGAYIS